MQATSVYLHIPFCSHRCGYCDFNTYAGQEDRIPQYVQALCREIELSQPDFGQPLPVHTVFFGGGTPSLLPPESLGAILEALDRRFHLQAGAEISLEANPGTLSSGYLKALRSLGINRLSLGMQSAHPGELRLLERRHGYSDVARAAGWARRAGFDNLNLDLIFGLPDGSLEVWQNSVELALGLQPDHLALYALTLEHGTPMRRWAARGLIAEPDPDLAAEMYEWAALRLEAAGFHQYEISNWARSTPQGERKACRHNLQYWRNLPYLGFGAGAHGYAGGVRTANVLAPAAYIRRCLDAAGPLSFPCTPATVSSQKIDRQTEIGETMMMGLRLTEEGVSAERFRARFGVELIQAFEQPVREMVEFGLLEWGGKQGDRLRLTPAGRLLGNQVFYRFL